MTSTGNSIGDLICEFTVHGAPMGKQRPRFDGRRRIAYTPRKTATYEKTVKLQANLAMQGKQMIEQGHAIATQIEIYHAIPTTWPKWKRNAAERHEVYASVKPDFDNVAKIICDSCNGIVYHDDSQVVASNIFKMHATQPRTVVRFYRLHLITSHTKTLQEAQNVRAKQ